MTEVLWRRSTRCDGGSCVEVAFLRSSRCDNSACVEVAVSQAGVLVRDGKDPDGPVLRFDTAEWSAFLAGAKAGEFDMGG